MCVTPQRCSYSLSRRCRATLQRVQLGQPHPFVKDVAALPHVPKVHKLLCSSGNEPFTSRCSQVVVAAIQCCCCSTPGQRANAYHVLHMLEHITQQDLQDSASAVASSTAAAATSASTTAHDSWGKVMGAAAAVVSHPPASSLKDATPAATRPADVRHRFPSSHTFRIITASPSSRTYAHCSGFMLKQRRSWGLGSELHQRWFVLDSCRLMWFAGVGDGGCL